MADLRKLDSKWIKKGIEDDEPIKRCEHIGKFLATYENGRKPLSTNQIRKFFGEVKRMQLMGYNDDSKKDFLLLKPKLAYAVARAKDNKAKIRDFYKIMVDAMSHVDSKETFKNFVNLFEAIIAFHKAAEDSKLELNDEKA